MGRLSHGYDELGFGRAADDDEVFRQLVLARIIEPSSKYVIERSGPDGAPEISTGSAAGLRAPGH